VVRSARSTYSSLVAAASFCTRKVVTPAGTVVCDGVHEVSVPITWTVLAARPAEGVAAGVPSPSPHEARPMARAGAIRARSARRSITKVRLT
jgi:hypothetical protein